jgi:tRNA(Ile)-lysidine synthetase-like protein
VGGDGTASEVIDGLTGETGPRDPEAHFGFIPRGTGGDLCRTLGIDPDVDSAARTLASRDVAVLDLGRLELVGPEAPAPEVAPVDVPGPGTYALPALGVRVEIGAARPDAVPWPLTLRTRRPGDRFRPEGGPGGTKLKRWLIDRKVPREARDRLVLLAAPAGAVLALPELGAVAEGLGPSGAGLRVRISAAPGPDGSYCKGGEGLL